MAAHGTVGGLTSLASGGKFMSGFLSAGFSAATGPIQIGGFAGNLVKSSVVGGFGSMLGGGKFANGAITATFGYLFNDAVKAYDFSQVFGLDAHVATIVIDKAGSATFYEYTGEGEPRIVDLGNVEVDKKGNLTDYGLRQVRSLAASAFKVQTGDQIIKVSYFKQADNVAGALLEFAKVTQEAYLPENGAGMCYNIQTNNCGHFANRICDAAGCNGNGHDWRPSKQYEEEKATGHAYE